MPLFTCKGERHMVQVGEVEVEAKDRREAQKKATEMLRQRDLWEDLEPWGETEWIIEKHK